MIGLFSWCLRSNRGMHCVITFAVEWLVVINNIEWLRARAVTFSVEFWRMLESTQTSQTCVLWDVPVFFSYTQGEKTSHTGLKFCPPPHPPPCTLLARHELTIVPKRVKWFANWSTLIGGVVEDWQMASISFGHYWKATHSHLLYSLFIGPNWMALGQPAPSDNFVVIDQVAQNSLKSFWVTLFVLQNVQDVFIFFSRSQKNKDKITCESTPPSPNCIAFRSLRAKTQCMCVVYTARYWRRGEEGGGGGGGWTFKNVFEALFPRLWKTRGILLPQK